MLIERIVFFWKIAVNGFVNVNKSFCWILLTSLESGTDTSRSESREVSVSRELPSRSETPSTLSTGNGKPIT